MKMNGKIVDFSDVQKMWKMKEVDFELLFMLRRVYRLKKM